ncbi:prepilin-type N-terminal cleavage/methylation domain-containing protein [Actinotalea sp. M2MS4P-6]|uniref:prepilin-type N-terminal cleavage/methylation domain-containing protein n=1 Tax=Actinotalea sp. M2MS4P-6 TaxID=2983762 RepID=UPI00296240F4|nr:prepilin-type N-terminal cleavage/methylation domain-containing protein [Actinotalea sp. M2MS4P-6]
MISRIRKSIEDKDQGFTLIELLVVIIIIGILAAIAIPLFLNQRHKAEDSAAKADVSTIGKEVATYFVDNTSVTGLAVTKTAATPAHYEMAGGDLTAAVDLGRVSNNVVLAKQTFTNPTNWCVSVQNPQGDKAVVGYRYSAAGGLEEGVCP